MNKKRWTVASLAAFVAAMAMEMFFNNVCLENVYMKHANLWRPVNEMMTKMPYYWIAALFVSFVFVYIYIKGYEGKSGLAEGFRFGTLVGLLVNLPMVTITYATMPVSMELPVSWFITGMFEYIVLGMIVGLIYKKPAI